MDNSNYEVALEATIELFDGDEKSAIKWLNSPKHFLSDKTPVSVLFTKEGLEKVLNYIGVIEHGIFT